MAEITIEGQSYPLRASIGAYRAFEESSGVRVAEVDTNDMIRVVELLWHFAKAGCKHEGVKFEVSLEDWFDSITVDQLPYLAETIVELMAKKKKAAVKASH
jgi:hypothetical protein